MTRSVHTSIDWSSVKIGDIFICLDMNNSAVLKCALIKLNRNAMNFAVVEPINYYNVWPIVSGIAVKIIDRDEKVDPFFDNGSHASLPNWLVSLYEKYENVKWAMFEYWEYLSIVVSK